MGIKTNQMSLNKSKSITQTKTQKLFLPEVMVLPKESSKRSKLSEVGRSILTRHSLSISEMRINHLHASILTEGKSDSVKVKLDQRLIKLADDFNSVILNQHKKEKEIVLKRKAIQSFRTVEDKSRLEEQSTLSKSVRLRRQLEQYLLQIECFKYEAEMLQKRASEMQEDTLILRKRILVKKQKVQAGKLAEHQLQDHYKNLVHAGSLLKQKKLTLKEEIDKEILTLEQKKEDVKLYLRKSEVSNIQEAARYKINFEFKVQGASGSKDVTTIRYRKLYLVEKLLELLMKQKIRKQLLKNFDQQHLFAKIKQATNTASPRLLILKFFKFEDSYSSLLEIIAMLQSKLMKLRLDRNLLGSTYEEEQRRNNRYNNEGDQSAGTQLSLSAYDEVDQESRTKKEVSQTRGLQVQLQKVRNWVMSQLIKLGQPKVLETAATRSTQELFKDLSAAVSKLLRGERAVGT